MRRGIALGVLIAALVAATIAAAGSPAREQRVPHYLLPNAVAFIDPAHGVLGTGYRYSGHAGGAIELTSDGGRNWRVVLRTPRPVTGLWAEGSFVYAQFDDGETLQSRDDGRTWIPSTTPVWPPTWAACPMGMYVGINAGDPSWALCTTQGGAGMEGKEVFRQPIGRGWKPVACTDFSNSHFPCGKRSYGGLSGLGYPLGIAGSARGGFGLIWESRGTIWVTRNSGRRWHALGKLVVFDEDFGSWASVLPRGSDGWAVITRGSDNVRLMATTDAGRSWRVIDHWTTASR